MKGEKIKHVIIILTPFQHKAITHLFSKIVNDQRTLIFFSEHVDGRQFHGHKEKMQNYNFSQKRIFKSPWKYIGTLRENVKSIKKSISLLQDKYTFSKELVIYIGSDKDVFTQLFIKALEKKTKSVIAVDEGLGYYVRLGGKDKLIQLIYKLFTPLLFGIRLYYIKRLGTLPGIDTIYLRDLDLLGQKKKNVQYLEFKFKSNQNSREIKKGKLLLFSFPDQHYLYPAEKKIRLYRDISDFLIKTNRELIIKPHPREDMESLYKGLADKKNVHLLKGSVTGETLDYFEYEFIVNVFSSIILDIISSSYPKNKLLTLGFKKSPPIKFDNELSYFVIDNFRIEKHIKFEN